MLLIVGLLIGYSIKLSRHSASAGSFRSATDAESVTICNLFGLPLSEEFDSLKVYFVIDDGSANYGQICCRIYSHAPASKGANTPRKWVELLHQTTVPDKSILIMPSLAGTEWWSNNVDVQNFDSFVPTEGTSDAKVVILVGQGANDGTILCAWQGESKRIPNSLIALAKQCDQGRVMPSRGTISVCTWSRSPISLSNPPSTEK